MIFTDDALLENIENMLMDAILYRNEAMKHDKGTSDRIIFKGRYLELKRKAYAFIDLLSHSIKTIEARKDFQLLIDGIEERVEAKIK